MGEKTNNESEIIWLLVGLQQLSAWNFSDLIVIGDSKIPIELLVKDGSTK